ncbi:unnamed protein product [Rotaria magnacalcarata]|uniref:DNA ligase 4 n=3 Tax=Rotaria magnacalcarata TaxID=392030 RepID=A0A814PKC0_9BILA|nr:unnamed protein product [Rotaria magnacalcarata]
MTSTMIDDQRTNDELLNSSKVVKFSNLCNLLERISKSQGSTAKQKLMTRFISDWRKIHKEVHANDLTAPTTTSATTTDGQTVATGSLSGASPTILQDSFYSILRLLLPQSDRERIAYGLKESKLGKHLVEVLSISKDSDDGKKLLNFRVQKNTRTQKGSDFAEVAYYVLKNRCNDDVTMSIWEINKILDEIAVENGKGKEGQKVIDHRLTYLLRHLSALELKWLIRILLKDLRISLKENSILECFHPDAKDLFDHTSNLFKVAIYLHDPEKRLHEIGLSLFSPFRPMLGERTRADKIEQLIRKKSTNPTAALAEFYIETKYDGDRFQLHRDKDQFMYFSRNGHDYTSVFGPDSNNIGTLTPYIANTFKIDCEKCIIDGEMVIYNRNEKIIHSKGDSFDCKSIQASDSQLQPCFIVFDILMYNDEILTNKPMNERFQYLHKKILEPIEGRIIFSAIKPGTSNQDVINELNLAIEERQEGIVVKDPWSVYKPNVRENGGWYKIKPDYTIGLNDEIDCLIVGGYFGTGRLRAGMLSHFLCCSVVKQANTSEQRNGDDENAGTSAQCKPDVRDYLYYTFCKIGSGYTHKELLDFNNRFANKWKPWTKKTAPAYILCTHEKPDVWIEPSDSCIVQVKATEFMASDKYKCGFTLRFPRLEKFREDKAWYECVTYQELIDLRERNAGKLASRFMEHEANDDFDVNDQGQPTKTLTTKSKTISRQQAKPTVDSRFRGIDQQAVKQTGHFFANLEFCIMEGNEKHAKAELEKLVYENGGTCVQNALAKTHCVITDNPSSIRLRTLIKNKQVDIVHIAWLIRCIEQHNLLPYNLSDLISCTDKTREALSLLYDEYGDAYFMPTNESELREIFNRMTSSKSTLVSPASTPSKKLPPNKKRRLDEPIPLSQSTIDIDTISNPLDDAVKLRSFINEFENVYFPDESYDYGLFRLFYIYFDQYWTIGDESTQFIDSNHSLIILESQLHGARIAHKITSDVTHVICAKPKLDDKKLSDRIDVFKKINRERTNKFHVIGYEWIKACITNQRLVKELPYVL